MDAATWGFIGTLVGAVVGSLASILTTLIAGANTRKLQSHADALLRLERSREFQRSNLLELQEALSRNMRLAARAHFEELDYRRKNSESKTRPLLREDLDQELSESYRRLSILVERLADNQLRNSIKNLRRDIWRVISAKTSDYDDTSFDVIVTEFEKITEEVGTILRSYY